MRVAIDTKNLALYQGGIAAFARPLVEAWVPAWPEVEFATVGPPLAQAIAACARARNCAHVAVAWPAQLPRPLRHPVFDLWSFPRAVRQLAPDWVFSFYHDVTLPPRHGPIRSVMMVHDTCVEDLPASYPRHVRGYLRFMLKRNLARADHIVTVSQASRGAIMDRYGIAADRVHVVYNAMPPSPPASAPRAILAGRHGRAVLYPGGTDVRKNLGRLLPAFGRLVDRGEDVVLFTTGQTSPAWREHLQRVAPRVQEKIIFLGRLSEPDLARAYREADAVVYPTLCEGFGRVCIEAMAEGTPLACSDLAVLREVAGAYPVYFNPRDDADIAHGLSMALAQGRREPIHDARFLPDVVTRSFLDLMGRIMGRARPS